MRRTAFGVVLVWAIAVAFLAVPAMQGPGRGPGDVEVVNGLEAAAREVLVRFRGPVLPPGLAALRAQADGEAVDEIGGTGVIRLRSRSVNAAGLLAILERRGDVLYAEPNYVVRTFAAPNDGRFPELWGLQNVRQIVNGGLPGTPGADIRAVPAWDVSVGSTAHVVAVIDTGIDAGHPDLASSMWSAPAPFSVRFGSGPPVNCPAGSHGFNAITRTCNPADDHSHGTHVAGTIGATGDNGFGVVGVNWTSRLMAIKFLDASGSGTIAGAVDAIRFAIEARRALGAAADIRVLSASWGGTGFSQALLDEINAAAAEDMLFVAAAGNSAMNNNLLPTYPASYAAPNVISVAATTNTDQRAWFSNYGASTVHLGAPGVNILSTTPQSSYTFASGTSMATPHVSGAAALVLSRCALDSPGLKDALLGTVQPIEALASVTITGGRLDVNSAIHTCVAPPHAPSGLAAAGDDGRVLLAWTPGLGATAYVIKRSTTPGGPFMIVASAVRGARYTDTTVQNGTTYYYVVSGTNPLGESADSNEASATPNPKPDLVVSALTGPSSAAAGSSMAVSVTTANQGGGPSVPSVTRVYLSANALFDAGDQPLEPAHDVPMLEPSASSEVSLSVLLPPDTAAGRYYLFAMADADRVIGETLESNNLRLRSLTVGPDLIVTGFSAPATAAAGEALQVTDTVKNHGGGTAPASTTSFYLSADATFDPGDVRLDGGRAVPALATDATSSGGTAVTIPAGTPVGAYYVIARADAGEVVAEAQESNNTLARSLRIGADLVVSAFSVPSPGGAGSSIVVSDTTANQGTAAADPSVTRYYLSANFQFDPDDTELGSRAIPALAAGQSSAGTSTVFVPAGTPTGSYYLLAVADADRTIHETVESNNQYARLIAIGGDLRVSSLTAPSLAGPGSSITVTDTTTNQGGGPVPGTSTRYYLSANSLFDAQDALLGGRPVPGLPPGASHTGSAAVTLPASVVAGTYYLIGRADGEDGVVETQEGNNVNVRTIRIGGDLAVSAFTAPARAGSGEAVPVSDTTTNKGTATVPASVTRFYLSPNASLDAGDTVLSGGRAVPELPPGAASSGSTTVAIPAGLATGVYYLFAKADGDDAVVETQEGNNTAIRSIQIGPDLIVSALAVPAKLEAGATILLGDTTLNEGGGASPPSLTTFVLSADWRLDEGDLALSGGRAVGALAPGMSSAGQGSVGIPAGVAPGSYYLIASADGRAEVAETSETNNTRSQIVRIGPDLAVSAASMPASGVEAGGTAAVSATVVNQGAGVAAASITRFYLSVNTNLDAADVLLPGGGAVPPLPTGGTSSGTATITIPAGTVPGTYWVLAKADGDDAVGESLENNNVRLVRNIQVVLP